MPFTSLSPKKGPEARSGPCTLYYPNELYEHKYIFFNFACLQNYQIRTCGLSKEDGKGTILHMTVILAVTQRHKGMIHHLPLLISPGISKGETKTNKTKGYGTSCKDVQSPALQKGMLRHFYSPFQDRYQTQRQFMVPQKTASCMFAHCLLLQVESGPRGWAHQRCHLRMQSALPAQQVRLNTEDRQRRSESITRSMLLLVPENYTAP